MKLVDSFSNRLQTALIYSNMKQVDLVEKTGLDKTLINKYLAGIMKAKQDKLTILAEALKVNEVWLMGYDVPMDVNIKVNKSGNILTIIPIINSVKIGSDYLNQNNLDGTIEVEKDLVGNGSEFFAIKCNDENMAPTLMKDDIVIIHMQNHCENNDIALVSVGDYEANFKKIKKTKNGIILQSINPAYEPVLYTYDEIKKIPIVIVGVVKQLKRNFK